MAVRHDADPIDIALDQIAQLVAAAKPADLSEQIAAALMVAVTWRIVFDSAFARNDHALVALAGREHRHAHEVYRELAELAAIRSEDSTASHN